MSTRGIFPGFCHDNGSVTFDFQSKAWEFNRHHFAGHEVEIEIRKKRSKRSLRQNAAYHASIEPLAEFLGYTVEELKLAMLGGCFGWKSVNGAQIPERLHTSDLNTQDFSDLMAYTVQIAAGFDILILDPSEWKAAKRKREKKAAKAAYGFTSAGNGHGRTRQANEPHDYSQSPWGGWQGEGWEP